MALSRSLNEQIQGERNLGKKKKKRRGKAKTSASTSLLLLVSNRRKWGKGYVQLSKFLLSNSAQSEWKEKRERSQKGGKGYGCFATANFSPFKSVGKKEWEGGEETLLGKGGRERREFRDSSSSISSRFEKGREGETRGKKKGRKGVGEGVRPLSPGLKSIFFDARLAILEEREGEKENFLGEKKKEEKKGGGASAGAIIVAHSLPLLQGH